MKSGTTSLFHNLSHHPEISPSIVKEPEFFSSNQSHRRKVDRYEELFKFDATRHSIALEASTGYTKYPQESHVPKSIHAYKIYPRFIYSVRNPFDRILSQYHFVSRFPEWKVTILDKTLVSISKYYNQLIQYRKYFPKERIKIIDFDDIVKNPKSVILELTDFLKINEVLPQSFEIKNKTLFGENRSVEVYNGDKTAPEVTYVRRKRLLSDTEREKIYSLLKEDMYKFHEEYGFEISKWGF